MIPSSVSTAIWALPSSRIRSRALPLPAAGRAAIYSQPSRTATPSGAR